MSTQNIENGNANVTDAEFTQISDMVYKHCGINLHDGKKELVQARIARQMRTGGFRTAGQYIENVLADSSGEKFSDLIDALSTNLTSFFRENQHFQHLSEKFLPKLIEKRNREGARVIRAWSAGCSSGEEPYTLAMVLSDALANQRFDVKILATDISRRVLSTARQGVYDEERLATAPAGVKQKYFMPGPHPGTVKVIPALQQMIRFNYLNLQGILAVQRPVRFHLLPECHDLFRQTDPAEAGQPLPRLPGARRAAVHRAFRIADRRETSLQVCPAHNLFPVLSINPQRALA